VGVESDHLRHQTAQGVAGVASQLKQTRFEHAQRRQRFLGGEHLRAEREFGLFAAARAGAEGEHGFGCVLRPDEIIDQQLWLYFLLPTVGFGAVKLVVGVDLVFKQQTFRRTNLRQGVDGFADFFRARRGRHHFQDKSSDGIISADHHAVACPHQFQANVRVLPEGIQDEAAWRGKALQPVRNGTGIIRRQEPVQRQTGLRQISRR